MAAEIELTRAAEHLRLAVPLMTKHRIPVTPRNYALWFEYVAGSIPELNEAIDALVDGGGELSDTVLAELYQEYIAGLEFQLAERAREALHELLGSTVESFSGANRDLTDMQSNIDTLSGRLDVNPSEEVVRDVASELSEQTVAIREHGERLRSELEERRREIETLRRELEQARREANTDPLTGLANRGAFDARLTELLSEVSDGARPFCLLLADIDHFKRINDKHGHVVGDKVIRFVAKTARDIVKGKDIVARYGGEEFAILLPETDLLGGATVAEHLRAAVERSRLVKSGTRESLGTITVSAGVALVRDTDDAEELIRRADAALYQAKQNGRNRVYDESAVDLPLAAAI